MRMMGISTWATLLLHFFVGGHHRSLIPYDINGPFKQGMMTLFRLAWSSKVQLPLLITVCFMAFDIRLQIEINIFWDQAHRRQEEPGDDFNEIEHQVQRVAIDERNQFDDGNLELDTVDDISSEDESDEEAEELPEGKDEDDSDDNGDDGDDNDGQAQGQTQPPSGNGNAHFGDQGRPGPTGGGFGDNRRGGGGNVGRDLSLILQVELRHHGLLPGGENESEKELDKVATPTGQQVYKSDYSFNILQKFHRLQKNTKSSCTGRSSVIAQIESVCWYKPSIIVTDLNSVPDRHPIFPSNFMWKSYGTC